ARQRRCSLRRRATGPAGSSTGGVIGASALTTRRLGAAGRGVECVDGVVQRREEPQPGSVADTLAREAPLAPPLLDEGALPRERQLDASQSKVIAQLRQQDSRRRVHSHRERRGVDDYGT